MKMTPIRWLGISGLLMMTSSAIAAPAPINSITTTPSSSPSTPVDDADGSSFTLSQITTSAATYSTLDGASAGGAGLLNVGDYYYIGNDPGSVANATSGLLLNATNAGGSTDSGDFTFSSASENDTFFLFEIGGNDSFTLEPIDSSNATIGSLTLTISSSDFGSTLMVLDTPHRGSGGSDASSNFGINGVAFTLSDFSGSGNLSNFAGFRITTSGGDLCALAAAGSSSGGGTYVGVEQAFTDFHIEPWGMVELDTSFSATFNTTENGGISTTYTFKDPMTGVDVSDPNNPDFTNASASYFGHDSGIDSIGVGDTNGRFERGESFTLEVSRRFQLGMFYWKNYSADEVLHISWTEGGSAQELLLNLTDEFQDLKGEGIIADANTPIIITNVSPTSAGSSGRLLLRFFTGSPVFDSEPTYALVDDTDGFAQMFGVNIAGLEFSSGPYHQDESPAQWDYYNTKGLRLIRYPFLWQDLQPTLNGPLDANFLAHLDAAVAETKARGMKIVLDMHNYGGRDGYKVGDSQLPYSAFEDVWNRIAAHYSGETALYGYGIMNEPKGVTVTQWLNACQAAVDGIRDEDMSTFVILPGSYSSNAHRWVNEGSYLINVNDPADKRMFEAHVYFDSNHSGTYSSSFDPNNGAIPVRPIARLAPFVAWLQENDLHGFVGEFGVPDDDPRWLPILESAMDYMLVNGVSGTYWAGGTAWGSYPLSIHPDNLYTEDKPQMAIVENYGDYANHVPEIVLDSELSAGITVTGNWPTSTNQGGYLNNNYRHDSDADKGNKSVEFTPDVQVAGDYEVYMVWTDYPTRANSVPVTINYVGGSTTVNVNQRINGGEWQSLGIYPFNAGTGGSVVVSNTGTNGPVIADGMKFVHRSTAGTVVLDSEDGTGITTTGAWSTSSVQSGHEGANYWHDGNTGSGKSVRFTPNLSAGDYEVFAIWTADSNRADNTPIDVVHAGGTALLSVNQETNGKQWVSLGTYTFNAGTGGSVLISNDGANGYVIVDAVKFEPQ